MKKIALSPQGFFECECYCLMSVCWNEYVRQYWCVDLYSMKIPAVMMSRCLFFFRYRVYLLALLRLRFCFVACGVPNLVVGWSLLLCELIVFILNFVDGGVVRIAGCG